jgi:hypothetical protein
MRTPIRALLAAAISVTALLVAAVGASTAAGATSEGPKQPSTAPVVGATCVIQDPNCNDVGFGLGSHAGGSPPASTAPGKSCGVIAPTSGPDGTVSYTPCTPPSGTPLEPRPQIVVPRPGMSGVRPIRFDSASVGPDDRTLAVQYWSGVEPCSVLDHVDVAYSSDAVTLMLYEGSDADAGMVACPDLAALKQVTVTLDQDLAGRRVVDGTV